MALSIVVITIENQNHFATQARSYQNLNISIPRAI
jgi:hypothetical protein